MALTKKHYKAIGEIIGSTVEDEKDIYPYITAGSLACRLAKYFAKDNPNFDRHKFLKACGLED